VRYWWSVSALQVWKWRKALGVGRMDSPGSRRLILAAVAKGADKTRGVPLSPEQVERLRRTARDLDLEQYLVPGYHGPRWTDEELALLGKLPDDAVARRTGRPAGAVRQKREALGIPNPADERRTWTADRDALVRTLPPAEVVHRTGHTIGAVYHRRSVLKAAGRRG
jgi:hypothetical protein